MSEMNQEFAAIQHLIEIEKNAASLIDSAKIDAEQCLSKAHAEYNAAYKEKFELMSRELEADFQKRHDEILQKYKDEVEAFKTEFAARPQNKEAFASLLDKLFFA